MNETVTFFLITAIVFTIPVLVLKFGKQFLTALLPIYLIIGNVFALSFMKLFGEFQTSLAVPIYSATFLITDILSEHFGKEDAKKAVWIGFIGQIILVTMMALIVHTPLLAAETNEAYSKVFSTLPRLIFASFTAYMCSQFLDVYIFHKIKEKNNQLWLRNNMSTIAAQLIDTTILIYIAFWAVGPFTTHSAIWNFILTTWVIKILVSILDTPFLYWTKSKYTTK